MKMSYSKPGIRLDILRNDVDKARKVMEDAKTLKYFERKGIRIITDDVIIGFGINPL